MILYEVIKVDPNVGLIYILRGQSYTGLGENIEAIKNYDKAIEINPNFANAYDGRGLSYGLLGNYKQAMDDLDRAIKLGTPNLQTLIPTGRLSIMPLATTNRP